MENPFAESLKDLDRSNTRRLAFGEQCAAYCALKLQVPLEAVSKAFGVSLGTVSYLARPGELRGGPDSLSRGGSRVRSPGRRGLCPQISHRRPFANASRSPSPAYQTQGSKSGTSIPGATIRAPDGYVGHPRPKASLSEYQADIWEIDIALHDRRARVIRGYFYRIGKPHPTPQWRGNPARHGGGFVTSTDCYRFARDYLAPK